MRRRLVAVVAVEARGDGVDIEALDVTGVAGVRSQRLEQARHACGYPPGATTPPMASYETSVLYALGRPMLPRAFRWKPEGSVPSTKVTSYDVGKPLPEDAQKRKREREERVRCR